METRPKLQPITGQLEESIKARAGRSALIAELEARNRAALKEIEARNKQIDFLLQAQDIESRIMALLNYLNQRPDDDRQNLLAQERETQAIILRNLEEYCKTL